MRHHRAGRISDGGAIQWGADPAGVAGLGNAMMMLLTGEVRLELDATGCLTLTPASKHATLLNH